MRFVWSLAALLLVTVSCTHGLRVDVYNNSILKETQFYPGLTGEFGPQQYNVSGYLYNMGSDKMCGTATSPNLTSLIAVVERGNCTFVKKANRAIALGARALIVGNNDPSDPDGLFRMGASGGSPGISIPVFVVSFNSYNSSSDSLLALFDRYPSGEFYANHWRRELDLEPEVPSLLMVIVNGLIILLLSGCIIAYIRKLRRRRQNRRAHVDPVVADNTVTNLPIVQYPGHREGVECTADELGASDLDTIASTDDEIGREIVSIDAIPVDTALDGTEGCEGTTVDAPPPPYDYLQDDPDLQLIDYSAMSSGTDEPVHADVEVEMMVPETHNDDDADAYADMMSPGQVVIEPYASPTGDSRKLDESDVESSIGRVCTEFKETPVEQRKPPSTAPLILNSRCSICLIDFTRGEDLRLLPCKHGFHAQCIDQYLMETLLCPLCRQPVHH